MNTFQFQDYRELISALLSEKMGRGAKVKLAEELNCQPGYISQVLNKSKIHFSPENIIKISAFLKLSPPEEEYLLNLLHLERAGSKELQNYYQKRVKKMQEEHLRIDKQIKDINRELSEVDKAVYYSHWAYAAIHMVVSIKGLQTLEAIVEKLSLKPRFVEKVLQFLSEKGLIEKLGEKYSVGKTRIHIKADAPLVKSHHLNYRHKAIHSLENENDFDLHYSSVMTLSFEDAQKIRDLVLKLIRDKEKVLIPSPNEEIICLNLDLFSF